MKTLTNHKFKLLSTAYLLLAITGIISSIFFQKHNGGDLTVKWIFEMSFYYILPAIGYIALLPAIKWISGKWPLHSISTFLVHLGISILLAPIFRVVILFVDFGIKYLAGIINESPWEVLWSVKYIIVATVFQPIVNYWVILFLIVLTKFLKNYESNNEREIYGHLTINSYGVQQLISQESIYFIEANGNYVNIHTKDQTYVTRNTLKKIKSKLNPEIFQQIHRSVITQPEAINNLKHWRNGEYLIHLKNNKVITSSRSYRDNVDILMGK